MKMLCFAQSIHTYNTAEKRMTEGLQNIKAVLLPIQEEVGGIPTSVISVALKETGLAEHAEEWLPQQGQCYCVFVLLPSAAPGT